MIGIVSRTHRFTPFVAAALAALSSTAQAQIAVSANDGKVKLDNGVVKIIKDGVDTISLIDLNANPPKSIVEINVPTSVAGPPMAVAITPNEQIALVTSAMKVDPADPTKQTPNDVLSVVDITRAGGMLQNVSARVQGKAAPSGYDPKILQTLQVGKGAAGVAINKAGTLGLVANRSEGTVSVLEIKGKTVSIQPEKIKLGAETSGPSGIVFTPDGKTALVTRDNDHKISVLAIEGNKVTDTKREMSAGMRPYGIDMGPKGDFAVVANIGAGSGDADTVSLIDMTAKPPRIVTTVSVGQTPEGIKISPDGSYVAVSAMNGTNKAKDNPFFNEKGKVIILRRQEKTLMRHAEADVGRWCQGLVWSSNGRKLVVQCMFEEQIVAFNWNGRALQLAGTIKTNGGPASIRTAEK